MALHAMSGTHSHKGTNRAKRKYRAVAVLRNTWEKRVPIGTFSGATLEEAYERASNSKRAADAARLDRKTGQLYDIELELVT